MKMHAWGPLLLTFLAACDKGSGPSAEGSASPSTSAPPSASAAPAGKLAAPGNDPAIVQAAQAVLASCTAKWRPTYGYESDCEAFRQFNALKVTSDARDATLVNLLEDDNERVRHLGVRGLASWGSAYRGDKALATRVVAAAARETCEAFTGLLGYEVGQIDAAKTGLGEPIKGLAMDEKVSPELRTGLISSFLPGNKESDLAFELTVELAAKGPAMRLRNAAVSALSAAYDKRPADVCKAWSQSLVAIEEPIAANAASRLTAGASWVGYNQNGWFTNSSYFVGENRCASLLDPTLAAIEKRQKDDRLKDDGWVTALKGALREDFKATPPAQKKRALTIARSMVEKKENGALLRGSALRLLGAVDPGAKAFAAKFESDSDASVKAVAASLSGSKGK